MSWMILVKYALSAGVIVLVSELVKRMDRLGALMASLPLVSLVVMIWMFVENQGTEKIATHSWYTFWFVLPTLPMFLLMSWMLQRGIGFWWSLLAGCLLTFCCFGLTAVIVRRFGVDLL